MCYKFLMTVCVATVCAIFSICNDNMCQYDDINV